MELFDTHSHINDPVFADDVDSVIKRSLAENTALIIVGTDYKSSKRAIEIANRYEKNVYAAVGLHPTELFSATEDDAGVARTVTAEKFSYDMYAMLTKFPKTLGIGEIGLDYAWPELDYDIEFKKRAQKDILAKQLEISRRFDLPALIHCCLLYTSPSPRD